MFSPFGFMGSQAVVPTDEYYFDFDFASGSSYPGSGTEIYDLSNNYTGSISGSLSYDGTTGYFTFTGNSANYLNVPYDSNMDYVGNVDSGLTMIMWARNTDTAGVDGGVFRKGWWGVDSNNQANYAFGKGFSTNDRGSGEFNTNLTNGDNMICPTNELWGPNLWRNVVVTMEYNATNNQTSGSLWLNNVSQSFFDNFPSGSGSIPGYAVANTNPLEIGKSRSTSTAWKGQIAVVKAYKGVWTSTEVNDYWNNTKTRFGL